VTLMTPPLLIHMAAGGVGVITGAVALSVTKGQRLHRALGTLFFVALLIMSASAAYLSILLQPGTFFGSTLTFYLVATAWMTVRREPNGIGLFERIAVFAALFCAAGTMALGIMAMKSPVGQFWGYPPPIHFFLTAVALIAAAGDIRVIRHRGIAGKPRIARHLWRMCFAFFEATSAFFIGKQKVFPMFLHGSPILIALGVAPLVAMIFFLVRLRSKTLIARSRDTLTHPGGQVTISAAPPP
jgi:uncharacterized membrane protein